MVLSKDELGKLVKEARKIKSKNIGKRYTQVMLCKDIGKSQGYIADIESGRTYPAFKVLSKIAEACQVPFLFFSRDREVFQQVLKKDLPNMSEEERKELASTINSYNSSLPEDIPYLGWGLDIYKDIHDNEKKIPDYLYDEMQSSNASDYEDYSDYMSSLPPENLDIKSLLASVLSKQGLTLNGEVLSEDSKSALSNAIQLGLQYAEQMQKKEKEKNSN
jgi:transcriptional regulator with XRE-family HTH domain